MILITPNVLCQKFISTSTGMKDTKDEVQTAQIQGAKDNYANSENIKERLIPSNQYTAIASSERDNYPLNSSRIW